MLQVMSRLPSPQTEAEAYVTFRLEGVTDIPLTPITMTATEDKQVATARAVLVN